MIINKETKEFQMRSDKPNENWLNENWAVIEDGSELAKKIIENYPYINILYVDDEVINVIADEEAKQNNMQRLNIENEILILKQKLFDTDYQAIKYAEGQIPEEGYAQIKAERQAWRNKINELEAELSKEGE